MSEMEQLGFALLFLLCSHTPMESSESRIAPSPGAASDDSASPIHQHPEAAEPAGLASPGCSGAEGGGTTDRLAFEPVPLRHREDGFTPERQRAYVEALADCGIAREAAARVGLSEQAINRVRRRADARSFDDACEAAHLFGARRLRSIAYERAIEGTLKGHYYHGERVGEERVYDNRLLVYLLGRTGHVLERDEKRSRAVCDNWEAHMEALEQGLPPPDPARRADEQSRADGLIMELLNEKVFRDEDGGWWTSFPPPPGFAGDEEGEYGDPGYRRRLAPREQSVMEADAAEELAEACALRDRYFGFADDGDSASREAETYETSEPSRPDPRPIEYKSLVPPSPARPPSFRRRPEPMSTVVRSFHRRRSWIPDQVRDDEEPLPPPGAGRHPGLRRPHIQTPRPRHPYR
jgi:hypothetical protein